MSALLETDAFVVFRTDHQNNTARLAQALRDAPAVREFKLSPTGD